MQGNKLQYTEFTDRMIWAVHGKSLYSEKAARTLLGSVVSPSQEAFTMFLYKNGFQKWAWMHNGYVSSAEASEASNGDTSDGSPGYIYTARTSDLFDKQKWGVVKVGHAEMIQRTVLKVKVLDENRLYITTTTWHS
jgi:hypothetical protein